MQEEAEEGRSEGVNADDDRRVFLSLYLTTERQLELIILGLM